jgi:ubiquinone/menaquinone biosynthesis C-methylase UbiE
VRRDRLQVAQRGYACDVSGLGPILGDISGGRVLDVATGRGGLISDLIAGLRDVGEIVGIDTNEDTASDFLEAFAETPNVRFERMDAYSLAFDDGSFDVAAVGSSLHHFADPAAILREMRRVVRPGGHVVVVEMYRNGQLPPEQTHVALHHWCAEIDTLSGTVHRKTFDRADVMSLIEELGLAGLRAIDVTDDREDPRDPDLMGDVEGIIDRYVALAVGHSELQARGGQVRALLRANGMRNAASIAVVGRV